MLFDAGLELDSTDNAAIPNVKGLFSRGNFNAVFFSHYHLDHMGLAPQIDKKIPLYIGEGAYRIIKAASAYTGKPLNFVCNTFKAGEKIKFGNITVTPILVDHSAFDSYMFLIEDDSEKILYTGDFRSGGRKSFDNFLRRLPKKIDTLICEGTNLSKPQGKTNTETYLEEKATRLMRKKTGPVFILQAATNIDRIVTMYRAAKKASRVFMQELYMSEIASVAKETIPSPLTHSDVRTFITRSLPKDCFRYKMLQKYGIGKIGRNEIAKKRFAICVRTSMIQYLKSLRELVPFTDGALIYSMWDGYKARPDVAEFINFCEESGLEVVTLHASGHADAETTKKLISHVQPKKIIPIHTENAAWFRENFPNCDAQHTATAILQNNRRNTHELK